MGMGKRRHFREQLYGGGFKGRVRGRDGKRISSVGHGGCLWNGDFREYSGGTDKRHAEGGLDPFHEVYTPD